MYVLRNCNDQNSGRTVVRTLRIGMAQIDAATPYFGRFEREYKKDIVFPDSG
jgi:hypothetical protein